MKKIISIGVQCFNEEENVGITNQEIRKITDRIDKYYFEFIFIDNGSLDKTRTEIEQIAKKDKKIKGIYLSRNFGPEASAQAFFDYACGDAVITIPCDLEDPPELIPKFIKRWEEGFNVVVGIYKKSEDDFVTAVIRKLFYAIFRKISNIDVPVNASGTGLLDRKALNALNSLPEKYRFFRGLRSWIGFKTTTVEYNRRKRQRGKSSYNFFDYFKHAERGIFGFSYLILDLMAYAGFILVLLSFLFIVGYLITVFVYGNPIKASIPLMLAIVFFGSVQILAVSIIGKYIQVVVEETKNRPTYIVEEIINEKNKANK